MEFKGEWLAADKDRFKSDMRVLVDFITEEEESKLLEEIEPYMKRLRYEFDHWDDVSSTKSKSGSYMYMYMVDI